MMTNGAARPLASLIIGGLTVWAGACLFIHGPAIIAYIGLQVLTSGVFAWQMRRVEAGAQRRRLQIAQTPLEAHRAA